MKIRNGFVSNSSSSSFCIYGTTLSDIKIDMEDYIKTHFEELLETVKEVEYFQEYPDNMPNTVEKMVEAFEDDPCWFWGLCFDIECFRTDWETYLGRSWKSIGDDETGKEFKNSVETMLSKLAGSPVECETFDETYYC